MKPVAAMGALILALVAAPSEARPYQGDSGTRVQNGSERGDHLSADRAAERVERSTGGRVLAVETAMEGGRTVYLVKVLLPGGLVRVVTVDGSTGKTR